MLFDGCRHKRGLTPWRLLCVICVIFSVPTGLCRSTGAGVADTLAPSPRKTLNQEIGSPSEIAWQAWLSLENNPGGPAALDSANLLRRITPKSIFIAPERRNETCQIGFKKDEKGECKAEPIDIDSEKQRQFFLKRLNALYGKVGGGKKKPAEPSEPLQINLPLPAKGNQPDSQPMPPPQKQPFPPQKEQKVQTEDWPSVVPQQRPAPKDENKKTEVIAEVAYEVENATKTKPEEDKEETSFVLGNSSVPKKDFEYAGPAVPVAEIVGDTNETFSGVIDYKIPVSTKTEFDKSSSLDQSQKIDTRHPSEKKLDDSLENSSPAVVLLLSATKLPSITTTTPKVSEVPKIDPSSQSSRSDQESEENENTTTASAETESKQDLTNSDGDDIRPAQDSTIQTVVPLDPQTADTIQSNTERAYTPNVPEDETEYPEEEEEEVTPTEAEPTDHEDYDETTENVDQDDFESEDELLKAGEAGMMISSKNQDLIRTKNPKEHGTTETDTTDLTSTTFADTTIITTTPIIYLQDAFDAGDSTLRDDPTSFTREDVPSTQPTESPSTIVTTIEPNVEDTTLYTERPLRFESLIKATTRASPTTLIGERDSQTDARPFFESEKELVTEPEVVYSTRESRPMLTTFGLKKPTHRPKIVKNPYSWDNSEDESELPPILRTTPSPFRRQQKPWFASSTSDDTVLFKNDDDIPSEFKDQISDNSRTIPTDHKRLPGYANSGESPTFIRFPEHLSEGRLQHSHVRFPSDDVNSIHNQDTYKDHLLAPYRSRDEYHSNSATSTKSSVTVRQKSPSAQWRVQPPGMRTDRKHQQYQQRIETSNDADTVTNQRQQKQKPMLLRFWARMPLVRDLTFYPTTSHGSHNEPIGGSQEDQASARLNSRFAPVSSGNSPNRKPNYYKEMSSHDVNRLLAQHMGQPSIGG